MARPNREESARKERIPVSASRAPLAVSGLDHDNFAPRWVNDDGDRIARFLAAGYEFVAKDKVNALVEATVDMSSGTDTRMKKPVGRGLFAYLMQLPRDLYNEDQRAKQREVDAIEDAIKRPGKGAVGNEVDYGKVSIQSKLGEESAKFTRIGS